MGLGAPQLGKPWSEHVRTCDKDAIPLLYATTFVGRLREVCFVANACAYGLKCTVYNSRYIHEGTYTAICTGKNFFDTIDSTLSSHPSKTPQNAAWSHRQMHKDHQIKWGLCQIIS